MKNGRGLKIGNPDHIPLERTDVLEDLKQFVDVHRITDFTLQDRVVPVIQLIRTEDVLILIASVFKGAVAAQFAVVQLWNGTPDKLLRPVAIYATNETANKLLLAFDTVINPGAPTLGTPVDRRRVGGPPSMGSAIVGSLLSSNQAPQPGGAAFLQITNPINVAAQPVDQKILETMALGPGTGLNIMSDGLNQAINVTVAWKVEPINRTRTGGL